MQISRTRMLRNNFTDGIKDTFEIILGDHDLESALNGMPSDYEFGLLDLLVIPLISRAMIRYGITPRHLSQPRVLNSQVFNGEFFSYDDGIWHDPDLAPVPGYYETLIGTIKEAITGIAHAIWHGLSRLTHASKVVIGSTGLLLQIPRYIAAGIITILLSPMVLLVHIIKYPFEKRIEHQFFQLQGRISDDDDPTASLQKFMWEEQLTIDELDVWHNKGRGIVVERKNTLLINQQRMPSGFPRTYTNNYFFAPAVSPMDRATTEAVEAGRLLGFEI